MPSVNNGYSASLSLGISQPISVRENSRTNNASISSQNSRLVDAAVLSDHNRLERVLNQINVSDLRDPSNDNSVDLSRLQLVRDLGSSVLYSVPDNIGSNARVLISNTDQGLSFIPVAPGEHDNGGDTLQVGGNFDGHTYTPIANASQYLVDVSERSTDQDTVSAHESSAFEPQQINDAEEFEAAVDNTFENALESLPHELLSLDLEIDPNIINTDVLRDLLNNSDADNATLLTVIREELAELQTYLQENGASSDALNHIVQHIRGVEDGQQANDNIGVSPDPQSANTDRFSSEPTDRSVRSETASASEPQQINDTEEFESAVENALENALESLPHELLSLGWETTDGNEFMRSLQNQILNNDQADDGAFRTQLTGLQNALRAENQESESLNLILSHLESREASRSQARLQEALASLPDELRSLANALNDGRAAFIEKVADKLPPLIHAANSRDDDGEVLEAILLIYYPYLSEIQAEFEPLGLTSDSLKHTLRHIEGEPVHASSTETQNATQRTSTVHSIYDGYILGDFESSKTIPSERVLTLRNNTNVDAAEFLAAAITQAISEEDINTGDIILQTAGFGDAHINDVAQVLKVPPRRLINIWRAAESTPSLDQRYHDALRAERFDFSNAESLRTTISSDSRKAWVTDLFKNLGIDTPEFLKL